MVPIPRGPLRMFRGESLQRDVYRNKPVLLIVRCAQLLQENGSQISRLLAGIRQRKLHQKKSIGQPSHSPLVLVLVCSEPDVIQDTWFSLRLYFVIALSYLTFLKRPAGKVH